MKKIPKGFSSTPMLVAKKGIVEKMIAEILCIGTELLMGQVVNTDAQFLSQQLSRMGIGVYRHTTIGDNPQRLRETFLTALDRSDIVITTGGLGPTMDDLTKETIADALGLKMVLHPESLETLRQWFQRFNRPMTPNNERQAWFPEGAIVLRNERGTAPACVVEAQGKAIIILPGPPRELTWIFENEVVPYLQRRVNSHFHTVNLRFFGIGESELEHRIKDMMEAQSNPTIAPYCATGEVMLRVTASAPTEEEARALAHPVCAQILDRVGQFLYTDRWDSLAETVVHLLAERRHTLCTAESCTGGMLASAIVDVPGCSAVMAGGVVSYSNEVKQNLLGVQEDTLRQYGAVSEQTAQEMALGALRAVPADYALATTGIAGPDGGTAEKPVGLVYIALARKNGETQVRRLLLQNRERAFVRHVTCLNALDMLRQAIIVDA